jgi:hypothetical protein
MPDGHERCSYVADEPRHRRATMDIVYLGLTAAFFAVSFLLVELCDRL